MKPAERLAVITDVVNAEGRAVISDLAERLGVSEMTVRRDLDRLQRAGAVRRLHGQAIKSTSSSYEPPFDVRAQHRAEAKDAIGAAVADLLRDQSTVVLDGGTTGCAVARHLVDREMTVCTPSLRVAEVLQDAPGIRLMLTGGLARRDERSLVGPAAVATLDQHRFDTYVMTVSGIDVTHGLTEWNVDDVVVKRAALRVSSHCIVASDSSKFGSVAFARIGALDEVDAIVSDPDLPADAQQALRAGGPLVHIATDAA